MGVSTGDREGHLVTVQDLLQVRGGRAVDPDSFSLLGPDPRRKKLKNIKRKNSRILVLIGASFEKIK